MNDKGFHSIFTSNSNENDAKHNLLTKFKSGRITFCVQKQKPMLQKGS